MNEGVLAGCRVLVVEDESLLMMLLEDMLGELGCTSLSAASSASEAIALLDSETFDVATLDVNLNGHSSYPIADVLAKRGIPFLFATGYGELVSGAHESRPMLQKPFRFEDLERQMSQLVGLSGRGHGQAGAGQA